MALPAGAQAQGQGKKILIYTGTTGFRHTDGINGGRPIIQSRLEGLGYTVDWEDCSSRATLESTSGRRTATTRTRTRGSSRPRTSRSTTRSCS